MGWVIALIGGTILTAYVVWTLILTVVLSTIGGWRWDQLGTAAWMVFKVMGVILIALGLIVGMWSGFVGLIGLMTGVQA